MQRQHNEQRVERKLGEWGLVVVLALVQTVGRADGEESPPLGAEAPATFDSSSWTLHDSEQTALRARQILGIPTDATATISASVETLQDDNTPYLREQLLGRPLWHVEIRDWSLHLNSDVRRRKDPYRRTLDVFLDPNSGQVVKLQTRWPPGEPPSAPEPTAESAAWQMLNGPSEIYHGIPDVPPPISFMEAVDILYRAGFNPFSAKQLIGHWVVWSCLGSDPKPMWVVTLRGLPPPAIPRYDPDIALYYQDHLRIVIDPVEKMWVRGSNSPQPHVAPPQ